MFMRNIISKLEKWAAKPNRKPLIISGSRQVGKTILVDVFLENVIYDANDVKKTFYFHTQILKHVREVLK